MTAKKPAPVHPGAGAALEEFLKPLGPSRQAGLEHRCAASAH